MEVIGNQIPPVTVGDFLESAVRRITIDLVAGESGLDRRIQEPSINRPAFALTGFYEYFANKRVQVFGGAEHAYLQSLDTEKRLQLLTSFFQTNIPCVVIARNRKLRPEIRELAERYKIPVLRTSMVTGHFLNAATLVMESLVAKQSKFQGTMLEVSGVGVLLEGRPGVGKSETALALIKRGHALVSDDVTLLRLDSSGAVVAASIDVTRYHMEIRGLGIIHVPSLFGVKSVRGEKQLDMIVTLFLAGTNEDSPLLRGPDEKTSSDVLGVQIPHVSIPVAPGRGIADLVEAAVLDRKLKLLGHDAAKELDEKLITRLTGGIAARD
ncbi:MAG: HPr(Ser) kinase/phosphatase [Verrucomicrobia bacterium]|nr:HPr(Ser) kinase/phosphatase [Verrucomicrobiota bacterium]